ncbi:MAG TPA: NUDIX hydrolase [Symbiobacteriaceae bacterium]|nr:NUDIX hydrolase [Symbiobacteriaceae bacterium]
MMLEQFAPEGVEAGVGLALEDGSGSYLFFLAGRKHGCPPGELFYAGVGGHKEPGEDWVACAHREAAEEIGAAIELLPSGVTWHVATSGAVAPVDVADGPKPLALYEMIHPPGTKRAGHLYRIVVYRARLLGAPKDLPPEEVGGLIALTPEQVACAPGERRALADLLRGGARLVAATREIREDALLYPIGTAAVLARVFGGALNSAQ